MHSILMKGVVQIPSNQLLRVFGSSRWLSTLIISWGIVSGLGCLIQSANGYIVQVCHLCGTSTVIQVAKQKACWRQQSEGAFIVFPCALACGCPAVSICVMRAVPAPVCTRYKVHSHFPDISSFCRFCGGHPFLPKQLHIIECF